MGYLHQEDDVAVLGLTGSNIGFLDSNQLYKVSHEGIDLLLFYALTEVATKLHRLKTDERFDSY